MEKTGKKQALINLFKGFDAAVHSSRTMQISTLNRANKRLGVAEDVVNLLMAK